MRELDVAAQLGKEALPQRIDVEERGDARDGDLRVRRLVRLILLVGRFQCLAPLLEQARQTLALVLLALRIVFAAPAAVEQRVLPLDGHLVNLTPVGAALAFEGGQLVTQVPQIESAEARLALHLFTRDEGRPDGAHDVLVGRHFHLLAGHVLECSLDAAVEGHAALEEDVVAHLAVLDHAVQVVIDDGVGQSADQVVGRQPTLAVIVDIALHEDGASVAQKHRIVAGQGRLAEFLLDIQAQPLGLLLQERAGPGGADLVHGEVHDRSVLQGDVFGVLPADLEDGVHVLIELHRPAGVRADLVLDEVGAHKLSDQVPPAPGGGAAPDVDLVAYLLAHIVQALLDGLDGPALGHEVAARDDITVLVDGHHVGADGADVHPDIGVDGGVRPVDGHAGGIDLVSVPLQRGQPLGALVALLQVLRQRLQRMV